ncbi:MAG: hypothetical protein ACJATG_002566, partial [Dinoroseobacter sp.]
MPARWENNKPMSRPAFDARFSDEEACSHYLAEHRWPEGFVCPSCGTCKGWPLNEIARLGNVPVAHGRHP